MTPCECDPMGEGIRPQDHSSWCPLQKDRCVDCGVPLVTVAGGLRECFNPACGMFAERSNPS